MIATAERSRGDGFVEKLDLFHGTDGLDVVRGISSNNFDFCLGGQNATRFGNGAYFAKEAIDKACMFYSTASTRTHSVSNGPCLIYDSFIPMVRLSRLCKIYFMLLD